MSNTGDLFNIGNFLVLVVSGAVIPLLLVLYKSRCKSICWGCIQRDLLPPEEKKPTLSEANKKAKEENLRLEVDDATEREPEVER